MTTTWTDDLDPRQQKELDFARTYATQYAHGTDGHSRLMLIAKLAELLDARSVATTTPLEQLIAAAQAAGSAGLWLVRGASAAALEWSFVADGTGFEHDMLLSPPHELIVLIRFPDGDGGESGIEFRQ